MARSPKVRCPSRSHAVLGCLVVAVAVLGRAQETPMSDDRTAAGAPTFSLWSPGLVTTHETYPYESFQIHSFHLGPRRNLFTVSYFMGEHSESMGIEAHDPVDWDTTVPWGAELFSVTAGVAPAAVTQFWVG